MHEDEIREYWHNRLIDPPVHSVRQETWRDKETKQIVSVWFAYLWTYVNASNKIEPFQRTRLSVPTWKRKSIPEFLLKRWGVTDHMLYIPKPWGQYGTCETVVLVEGVPDVLTWEAAGVNAIGAKTAWCLNPATPSGAQFHKELQAFRDVVQWGQLIPVLDGDAPNWIDPAKDINHFWYTHLSQYASLFVDWRQWRADWFKLGEEWNAMYQKDRGYPMLKDEQAAFWGAWGYQWKKVDSNSHWQAFGGDAEKFLADMRSLMVEKPLMSELPTQTSKFATGLTQKPFARKRVDEPVRFPCLEDVRDYLKGYTRVSDRSEKGWYRFHCPIQQHPNQRENGSGCAGVTQRPGYDHYVLHCHGGCSQQSLMAAFNLSWRDLRVMA